MLDNSANDTVLHAIAFATVENLLLLCYAKGEPSDAEWEMWLQRVRRYEHRAILISTDGGAPTSRQRARVAEVTRYGPGQRPPVALLTDSVVMRHVITTFRWLLGGDHRTKMFPRGAVAEAVSWLDSNTSPERVQAAVERLHAELAGRQYPPIA